jgi:hypothetical protein
LAEGDAILNPEIAHGHGFGAARFDGAVGEASGGSIVHLDGSWRLRETEFVQSSTQGSGFATVVAETTEFGFGGGGDDFFEDVSDGRMGPFRVGWGLPVLGPVLGALSLR